jgi:hypothetical protein
MGTLMLEKLIIACGKNTLAREINTPFSSTMKNNNVCTMYHGTECMWDELGDDVSEECRIVELRYMDEPRNGVACKNTTTTRRGVAWRAAAEAATAEAAAAAAASSKRLNRTPTVWPERQVPEQQVVAA